MTLPRGTSSGRGNARLSSAIGRPDATSTAPARRAPVTPKRQKPLKRTSALKPATKPLKARPKAKRPGGADAALAWREACLQRNIETYGVATCEATGLHLLPDWSCHHVIEASSLNAMGLGGSPVLVWHPDNGMCVNRQAHLDHHNWSPRITADKLRAFHWDFAVLLDNTHGTEWASARLARDYPLAA